jgi:hypothetical protein
VLKNLILGNPREMNSELYLLGKKDVNEEEDFFQITQDLNKMK